MKAVTMKAVLPYDASPSIRAIIAAAPTATVDIVRLDEADRDGLLGELATADVFLHVLAPVTADLMRRAPKLRLVQKIGIGVDTIDLAFAKQSGIAVCNMPGTNTAAVAELALGLMLACLRRIVPISNDLTGGGWSVRPELLDGAGEIGQRCVGLIGYGAVARRLATAVRALGARVIAHDPMAGEADVEMVSLDRLLAEADIVSLHVPLTPQTRALLDRDRIARMKPGTVIVNTARGPLIDEAALVEALASRHIAAAGLDVLAEEPPRGPNPLLASPHVVATPHIAWMTDGTWRRSIAVIVENCRRLAAGEPLLHRVV
ncbi:2-hydroxyacid dehydrogenase [Xanthobacteraceae bacterium Astr-EGSB]|uniref:NAD(P)-dependent oxidoreductase n=1 Tax=Astrobacterium formosum TaxID=3069710 RepID=UPI0027B82003|nr:2-hydroxyacid dehydrogenase [Xanthobacteraceae bacterium Astr-EGSB]